MYFGGPTGAYVTHINVYQKLQKILTDIGKRWQLLNELVRSTLRWQKTE